MVKRNKKRQTTSLGDPLKTKNKKRKRNALFKESSKLKFFWSGTIVLAGDQSPSQSNRWNVSLATKASANMRDVHVSSKLVAKTGQTKPLAHGKTKLETPK